MSDPAGIRMSLLTMAVAAELGALPLWVATALDTAVDEIRKGNGAFGDGMIAVVAMWVCETYGQKRGEALGGRVSAALREIRDGSVH